ncbi:hypothetical protein GO755_05395 [Spirosoma sp. HMF4905]|uniref:Organic solvent tolerance-like N-terminal domain-containing protein n=1 Tax=Spirosoma arboris TaxID=2682092 RepID=A0A7K1S6L9_9BACT|nr:hypothetical protein [Spirosoma arboris]MVM29457.1 hypothetical protein [Spirosoma arboris]
MKNIHLCLLLLFIYCSANAQITNYFINGNRVFIVKVGHLVVSEKRELSFQIYHTFDEGENTFKLNLDGTFSVFSSTIFSQNCQNCLVAILADKQISESSFTEKVNKIGSTSILYNGAKVSRIGNTSILYNGDKMSRIGNTPILYAGAKVSRIGDTPILYSGDKVSRIGDMAILYSGDKVSRVGDITL